MKIIQCQRCDADVLGRINRKYCTPCAKVRHAETRKQGAARVRAINDALRMMANKNYTPRSRAIAGEGEP